MKGMSNKTKILAIAAAAILPGFATSQQISVVVNGDPVTFEGVGPQQVGGRVLVPLRGVMEKLGAYVGWDQGTRTVTATKTGVDLVLRLGDHNAMVNGRSVYLDVPAQEMRGSTMVPLRFVGEALGADVAWNPTNYTVNITTVTTGSANQQIDPNQYTPPRNTNPGSVSIQSFDIDHTGTVRGNDELRLTLKGTPGGNATFSIPGVIQDVQMTEREPGVYVGTFRVPDNSPINLSRASAVARLRIGDTERMIQSGSTLAFDNQPPLITSVTPNPDTRVTRARPNISASFDDAGGSGVDPRSVEIRLDNRDVTRDAQVTPTFVSYRPDQALSSGEHEVSIRARDNAGNPVTKNWTFRVMTNRDVIRSFNYDAGGQALLPGTEVTFTLEGEPGGKASFSVGDRIIDRRMDEVSPGKYVGHYTIRRNDSFEDVPVTAKLETQSGDTFTYDAPTRFRMTARSLEAPTITDPSEDTRIGDNLRIRGTAAPGSKVQVKVDYSRTTLGLFKMTGTLAETEVTADDQGRWITDPIDVRTGLGGGSTTYTITAVTIGPNGRKSDTTKLTLKS